MSRLNPFSLEGGKTRKGGTGKSRGKKGRSFYGRMEGYSGRVRALVRTDKPRT
jgi:hypothetical protein